MLCKPQLVQHVAVGLVSRASGRDLLYSCPMFLVPVYFKVSTAFPSALHFCCIPRVPSQSFILMATLPSFVELMASLGIDPVKSVPDQSPPPPSSSLSSPSSSPKLLSVPGSGPTRSKSSPSLRDQASRRSSARYSPYASSTFERRRGSVSSMSSSSDISDRASSASPHPPSPRIRKRGNKLTVNVFGSSTDLSANTPISSYVRRKTPGASPTSPTFPRDIIEESPRPFVLPTLPPFLPQSSGSDSFPVTPNSDLDSSSGRISPDVVKPLPDTAEAGILSRRSRVPTGIRISTPPRYNDVGGKYSRPSVVHVA
ncbi:hypothetical protein K435DRAFT_291875 [Dendrothele bispora CBS 962.96]|uniref:Uncharacterized protein n=1 Tax=Dendrothele bispora (strain CBS 962.96) TaxID=1314807 RepID=A0A4S8MKG4_DENBC|nr:hypothetical protein K435DRAFT_291875 [Dendrothele bispora CBS 962.96]